jgi:glycerol-3-phosphate dehydrogenase (NAD(P)+)
MKIGILGAGAYGTALAINFAHNGHEVTLFPRRESHAMDMKIAGENAKYLPGIPLNKISISIDGSDLQDMGTVFFVCPAQSLSDVYRKHADLIKKITPIIICSKGISIENSTLPMHMMESAKNQIAIFSGPHFAKEVAALKPSAVTVSSSDTNLAFDLSQELSSPILKVYPESDIIGVQIGGAVKNVIAIATGIARGMNLGENAIAALITRGLIEMKRLGIAMGAKPHTFFGLACLGDLTLTCSSTQSRNTTVGIELAQGTTLDAILSNRTSVAEGVFTAKAVFNLMNSHNVYMPICHAVYEILYENKNVNDAIKSLMTSPPQWETA